MYQDQVIGQDMLKKQFRLTISKQQTPHAQLLVDENGYGGLPLALYQALLLTYPPETLTAKKQAGISGLKLLEHPDIHFIYPVVNTSGKSKTLAEDYRRDWYSFINDSPYGAYTDWYAAINAGNKQGLIAVHEVEALHKKMYLKSYVGGNKVCVIWGIDKMNPTAANKFLKLLEEPPKNTFFILVASQISTLLPTVLSRCQVVDLKPIAEMDLKEYMQRPEYHNLGVSSVEPFSGSMRFLLNHLNAETSIDFEALFITCLRTAFRAKGNKSVVIDLMQWVDEVAVLGREDQKAFLLYAIGLLRKAFLLNYSMDRLVHFESKNNFDLKKLAPFVHSENMVALVALLENAYSFTERNVNAKMLFTDLALQITRLLNKKG